MHSWDNRNGGEGETPLSLPQKNPCPHRVWFGDYSLNYCDIDKEICNGKHPKMNCAKLLQKKKE